MAHRQTHPVQVVFMAYRNSLQADALKLVAKKLQSSLAVEGELPEDGLAAYGDDGDDLMLALARKIVSGDDEGADSIESVFAEAQQVAAEAEGLLVDDGWQAVEVEPEVAEVHADGNATNGIGTSVELVPGNGQAAVPVNANGRAPDGSGRDDAPEPHQSLFSWAEFMAEEPTTPRRQLRLAVRRHHRACAPRHPQPPRRRGRAGQAGRVAG